jgi:uncharacterized protein (TIGR02453 family)
MPITRQTFDFMAELYDHNNKKWFDANRQRYIDHVREPIKELAESLSVPVGMILPDFVGKAHISRINNDIRFSPDKKPYKEHVWIAFREDNPAPAQLFVYISRNGWGAGAAIGSPTKEHLHDWRRNLIENADVWVRYGKAMGLGKKVPIYTETVYKKPLYDDIPDEVYEPVQAKGVWVVEEGTKRKLKPVENDFYIELCKLLPTYIFMSSPRGQLKSNLAKLGKSIKTADRSIAKIWSAVKGG